MIEYRQIATRRDRLGTAVVLRPIQREDVPRVMEIERECFPTPWHESAYLTEIANRSAYYVVACAGSDIVGYAGMWIITDEAHITTLGVARSHRGRRIGEQLLIGLIDEARRRGARRATLEVRRGNSVAQNLYHKYGFSPAAIRRAYYTDNGEDAVVMWVDDLHSAAFSRNYDEQKQHVADQLSKATAEETA
jgi:[ribosomal protein S18]-alanine N-acetyltransferase